MARRRSTACAHDHARRHRDARIAARRDYKIAGKTGTAQVFSVAQNEKYDEKNVDERLRDHAWFIAFAPAEDPQIAVAVLVENGGFGASASPRRSRARSWTPTCCRKSAAAAPRNGTRGGPARRQLRCRPGRRST